IDNRYNGANITYVDLADGETESGERIIALDLADSDAIHDFAAGKQFDIVINCAAMTNVDACETDTVTALRANAIGARNIATFANLTGAKVVHVSTDYVFAGDADAPYSEWDLPAPNTAYGKSKLLGEKFVREVEPNSFIVRTSWLYGYIGNNFVKTMSRLAKEKEAITVVNDQVGNPTHANDLAHHILKIALTDEYGIYHITGQGICSWFDFATEIIRLSGETCTVNPCTTAEYPSNTPRPAYSAMDHLMLRSTVGDEMREWHVALEEYMKNWREDIVR
ncbi:MAG: dTDP-4-dehydrorhamnose reductase, partial [Clostridiales Family XIII bacterium]|nr:dTDP-4-dehydrorhamnose reductase [Clostridiales Family XIII bacterium]